MIAIGDEVEILTFTVFPNDLFLDKEADATKDSVDNKHVHHHDYSQICHSILGLGKILHQSYHIANDNHPCGCIPILPLRPHLEQKFHGRPRNVCASLVSAGRVYYQGGCCCFHNGCHDKNCSFY
jgi:hypothetical protein